MENSCSTYALPIVLTVLLTTSVWVNSSAIADDWTQFRGDGGVSVGDTAVPTTFDDQHNIAWKAELPGKGASGPIVVGDQVIVTSSGGGSRISYTFNPLIGLMAK